MQGFVGADRAQFSAGPGGPGGGGAGGPLLWSDVVEPLLALSSEERHLLHDRSRRVLADEKLKAIDILAQKKIAIDAAFARASADPDRATLIRNRVLERAYELSKDECGCLMVSHLLGLAEPHPVPAHHAVASVPVTWEEIGASDPMVEHVDSIFPGDISYTATLGADGVRMQIVGIEVPEHLDGISVVDLKLRQEYRFLAVALETGRGLDVRVRTLIAGCRLWVGFEFETAQPQEYIRKFVGELPQALLVRYLQLGSFRIDAKPQWIGKNLVQNRIRADYDVNVIGIYPARTSSVMDIVWFPAAERVLNAGDQLLVLNKDLAKLKAPQPADLPVESHFVGRLVAALCAGDGPGGGASSFGARSNRVVELSKDKNGCHVIQAALASAPPLLKTRIVARLMEQPEALLQDVIKSQHGIHVVRSSLVQAFDRKLCPESRCREFADFLLRLVEAEADIRPNEQRPLPGKFLGAPGALLDKKKFSYRLVLWLIEFFRDDERILGLMDAFASNTRQLIDDNNGSIVLSSVLEYGREVHKERVFGVVLDRIDTDPIPKHWYPSFLIDKMILDRHILDSIWNGKARLLQALLRKGNLQRIQAHRSGSYTARRVFQDLATDEERGELARVCPRLLEADVREDVDRKKPEKKTDFNFNDSLLNSAARPFQL